MATLCPRGLRVTMRGGSRGSTTTTRAFAGTTADSRRRGGRPKILDTLIAATALSRGMPVYTRDADFEDMAGLQVVRA